MSGLSLSHSHIQSAVRNYTWHKIFLARTYKKKIRSLHSLWLRIYFTSCDDWMHRSNAWRNDVRIFQVYGIAISCFLLLQKFICETVFNYLTNTLSWNSVWADQRSYWTNRINEIRFIVVGGSPFGKIYTEKK